MAHVWAFLPLFAPSSVYFHHSVASVGGVASVAVIYLGPTVSFMAYAQHMASSTLRSISDLKEVGRFLSPKQLSGAFLNGRAVVPLMNPVQMLPPCLGIVLVPTEYCPAKQPW